MQVTAALLADEVWIDNGMIVLVFVVVVGMVLELLLVGWVCADGTAVEMKKNRSAVIGHL